MKTVYAFVWQYVVRPGWVERFRAAYGGDGEWAAWFRGATGYVQTILLEDAERPDRFMTIDYFLSKAARDDFVAANRAGYDALDEKWALATLEEHKIGEFVTAL